VWLHSHEWGAPEATPVVCLHGVTGYGGRFGALAERLQDRFRVIAPDLRGHGRSGWEPPWNLETHVADVSETVASLGLTPPVSWIGHSFGARLIMELDDGLVERQLLLDPIVQLTPDLGLARAEAERTEKAYATVEEAIEARYASGLHLHTPRHRLEYEATEHLQTSPGGLLRWNYCQSAVVAAFGELCREPPAYERRPAPTLLVLGADVSFTRLEQAERFANAEVARVPGGHLVLSDAFDETAAVIEAFLT
jgi:lipase